MKPAFPQRLGGFLRPVPVAGKNVRAAHYDLVVLAEPHLDAADGWPYPSGFDVARIIHSANGSGLGQAIDLQYWNTQHIEVELRVHVQRRGTADQGFQVLANHFLADGGKDHRIRQGQPRLVKEPDLAFPLSHPRCLGATVNYPREAARFPELLVYGL